MKERRVSILCHRKNALKMLRDTYGAYYIDVIKTTDVPFEVWHWLARLNCAV